MGLFNKFALAALFIASSLAAAKPNIYILATGGTIAGSAAGSTNAQYDAGQLGVDILIKAVPEIQDIANIKGEQVANISSNNMTNEI